MKTLLIVTTGLQRFGREELLRREASDEFPRVTLFETKLNSDLVNELYLQQITSWRKLLYKLLPAFFAQVIETYIKRKNYDAILSWSERRAFLFALFLKITCSKVKHIALLYWMSKPKQAFFIRLAQSHIHHIITWSSVQRDFAVKFLKIPISKITLVGYPVDQKFWRPIDKQTDMICSVGSEMRDYQTLIRAMDGLEINCHIAAPNIRIIKGNSSFTLGTEELGVLPKNVIVGYKAYLQLRELYARSRFVVVPLLPSDTDNGVSTILEAMAMGKTVICTRTKGQVDVIQEGKTGFFVEQGDVKALRDAIVYLWNNPNLAEEMGNEARKYIEKHHTLDQFVESVKNVIEDVTGKQFHDQVFKGNVEAKTENIRRDQAN